MKQINYTGSSKLISRIVALLNGKAPLPEDGNGDPEWGTSGQVLSTDGSGSTSWITVSGGGGTTYTMSLTGHVLKLTDGNGNVQSVTLPDDDTTYTFALNDHTLTITPSSGAAQTINLPDNNTTYTMTINGTTLKLTDSNGTEQTVTIPDTTYSAGDGIDITSNTISLEYFSVNADGAVCLTFDDGN